MHFNIDKILEDADAREIAEAIGMKLVKRGSSVFTECPEHEKNTGKKDTDYDRCVINEKGYYCFSCGAKGNAIDMVIKYLGQSFPDACKTICSIIGNIDNYTDNAKNTTVEMPYTKIQLEALGLCTSARAYLPIALCLDEEELTEKHLIQMPGEKKQTYLRVGKNAELEFFIPDKGNPTPDLFTYSSPLITGCRREIFTLNALFQEEPEVFHELIKNKAQEMYWKWKNMLDSKTADKLLSPEIAYHINARYRNWMGICERIYQGYTKQPA